MTLFEVNNGSGFQDGSAHGGRRGAAGALAAAEAGGVADAAARGSAAANAVAAHDAAKSGSAAAGAEGAEAHSRRCCSCCCSTTIGVDAMGEIVNCPTAAPN